MKRVVHDQVASMQFRPDAHHRCVQAVLKDPKLSSDEKRAILSAWASHMYAVESSPMLRMIPGHTTPLRLSEILSALRGLDDDDPPPRGGAAKRMTAGNGGADRHAAIAPAVYHLARPRREADLRAAPIKAHRDNIRRYKRILGTDLTDLERQFVVRRLAEEQYAIRKFSQGTDFGRYRRRPFTCAAGKATESALRQKRKKDLKWPLTVLLEPMAGLRLGETELQKGPQPPTLRTY